MVLKFIHKPVHHFYNKKCKVSVSFKQRDNKLISVFSNVSFDEYE